jgi:hypothetical protein
MILRAGTNSIPVFSLVFNHCSPRRPGGSLIIALELKERTAIMKVGGEVKATVSGISIA